MLSDSLPTFRLDDGDQEREFPNGRAALLAFVHEECATCRLSMPLIREMQAAFGSDMDVWIIGQDEAGNRILVDEFDLPGPMLDDSSLKVSYEYEVETVPTLILSDAEGREQRRFHGFGREDFRDTVADLVRITGKQAPEVAWDSYPESRPGCGSRSMEPGIYERLKAEAEGSPLRARRIEVGGEEDIYELLYEQGVTDGLPVIPPTPDRVLRMLEYTRRDPQEEIAVLAPNLAPLTIEKVAINAVMAGCKPEYFPVVLAATEAISTSEFNIHGGLASTVGGSPVLVVNGPIRELIGMNSGQGVLGQGNRANATIGRAVRLVIRNIGGHKPGGTERATIGWPGKYTLCFAEAEERTPAWTPLHVERGFSADDSVVTAVIQSGGPAQVVDQTSRTARALSGSLGLKAAAIQHPKQAAWGQTLVIISPEHYDTIAGDGWTKADLRRRMYEVSTRPLRDLLANQDVGGLEPGAIRRIVGKEEVTEADLDIQVPKFAKEEFILIVAAGGGAGKFSAIMEPFMSGPGGTLAVSRKIELLA